MTSSSALPCPALLQAFDLLWTICRRSQGPKVEQVKLSRAEPSRTDYVVTITNDLVRIADLANGFMTFSSFENRVRECSW